MARLMFGSVVANGINIQYYRTGGEKPPVILLHGIADYGLCWGRLPLFLEPLYDLVMVDLRGHGMSDKPEEGYRNEDMAADVVWVIHTLNLVKPVIIGHSMGADVAATLAATNPQLVSGVVLEDPPWRIEKQDPEARQQKAQEYLEWIHTLKKNSLQENIAHSQQEHPNWDDSEFMQWSKGKMLVSPHSAGYFHTEQRPWQEIVENIRVPGLLIRADVERGAIVDAETARLAQEKWKKLEVAYLPGAGHSIHREQYYKFRDAVKQFLRRLL